MPDNSTFGDCIPADSSGGLDNADLGLTLEEREDLESSSAPVGGITYRSQDFDVRGLVERLESGDILIPRIGLANPDLEVNEFQRGFVWSKKQMDSFIESLLLEYPVPSLFMVQQSDRRLVILDGQQRLETLRRFYSGLNEERKYRLGLTGSVYAGKSYMDLQDRDKRILDNTYITSTIISFGPGKNAHEAIYDVFARLNSGGTQLTPHEIRMALFNGNLMRVVDEANQKPQWRKLYGSSVPNRRFRDHELILRILALFLRGSAYSKPLSGFLNSFSEQYRDADSADLTHAIELFNQASNLLVHSGLEKPFSLEGKSQLNNARAEAIIVGIMKMLSDGEQLTNTELERLISKLNGDERFELATTRATSDEPQVKARIECVAAALAAIKDDENGLAQ